MADKEASEIKILEEFLPDQLGEEEIKEIVANVINDSGASSPQDMGQVMGLLKSKFQGNADMGVVSKIVKEALKN